MSRPRIVVWGARTLYVGRGFALRPHRVAVTVLAVGLDGELEIATPDAPGYQTVRAAAIPANTLHHLRTGETTMAFLYVDALGADARALAAPPERAVERFRRAISDGASAPASALARGALGGLGLEEPAEIDTLAPLLAALRDRPQDVRSAAQAARCVALSASRFQHVFTEAMGVPFRRYRLWRRMAVALFAAHEGASLTSAALDAGFASSAHFSTSFRAMFGMRPSDLLRARPILERVV